MELKKNIQVGKNNFKLIFLILLFYFFLFINLKSEDNLEGTFTDIKILDKISSKNVLLKLKNGDVKIELFSDTAPNHVKRIKELADAGKYDNVVFHRVIDGFMAQTGDVKFGNSSSDDFDLRRAGMGGSDLPDLKQEFSNLPHDRGTLSMARSSDPNSANSQFFICFKPAPFLDNQYTVFGKVIEGMEFVDKIKRGDENNNGAVTDPDKIISFKSL